MLYHEILGASTAFPSKIYDRPPWSGSSFPGPDLCGAAAVPAVDDPGHELFEFSILGPACLYGLSNLVPKSREAHKGKRLVYESGEPLSDPDAPGL